MNKPLLLIICFFLATVSLAQTGDYIVIDESGSEFILGESSGSQVMIAQQFITQYGGDLKTVEFSYGTFNGSPGGDIEWSIRQDYFDTPGAEVWTEYQHPTESGGGGGQLLVVKPYIQPNAKYWLMLKADPQLVGNSYTVVGGEITDYTGKFATSTDDGYTWSTTDSLDMYLIIAVGDTPATGFTGDPTVFSDDDSWLHLEDMIAYLEDVLDYINSLPDNLTYFNGTQYLPDETATQMIGYAKWLFSPTTANELLGETLAPIGINLFLLLTILVLLMITWAIVRVVVLILRFVRYVARWILDLIPGT